MKQPYRKSERPGIAPAYQARRAQVGRSNPRLSRWVTITCSFGLAMLLLATVGCAIFKTGSEATLKALTSQVAQSTARAQSSAEQDSSDAARSNRQNINKASKSKTTSVTKVRLDGSLSLGDTDNLAFTSKALAKALHDLLENEQNASAINLVQLYPDLIARVMIENHTAELSVASRKGIVDLYQHVWGNESSAYLALKKSYESGTTTAAIKSQRTFLKLLEQNQPEQALQLRIGKQIANNPILEAEAMRLEAMAYLMLEDHQQSTSRLQVASDLLSEIQPLESNRLKLLLGETLRRKGAQDGWKQAWRAAVTDQSRWLESTRLSDPQFWKQAAFLRPISEAWPEPVLRRMRIFVSRYGIDFDKRDTDESIVWAVIGLNSLNRHESQNAILSFKKSESTIANRFMKKELQMQQAIAMIEGGQPGPASAILLRLSSDPGILADRAKAVLATLKLQNGSLAQGMSLLQSAIKTSSQWPESERLRAQADYGLAYLMRGKEALGIKLLNQVYMDFVEQQDFAQASQCLFNISTYYEKTDKVQEQKETRARLVALELNMR